jgi:hypothetical protein
MRRPRPGVRRLARRTPLKRRTPLARTTLQRRAPMAEASRAQRAKVAAARCIVCGSAARIDPAHVVPRRSAVATSPHARSRRAAHTTAPTTVATSTSRPHLEATVRIEIAHAVMHLGLIGALRRLAGDGQTEMRSSHPIDAPGLGRRRPGRRWPSD